MRIVVLLAFLPCSAAIAQQAVRTVPYVGCKSSSFVEGPSEAPLGPPKEVRLPPGTAQRLAYYVSRIGAVLGPRGWYCFGYVGSAGTTFYVSPHPISPQGPDVSGPLIMIEGRNGETSGRFEVAEVISRVFPEHQDFVASILAERTYPNLSFPSGSYPQDKLSYKSAEIVEYETPAQTVGLGTYAGMKPNGDLIRGVGILSLRPIGLDLLAVRPPNDLRDLTPAIVQQTLDSQPSEAAPASQK